MKKKLIEPYDEANKFAIACSSSNEYVPYLSVYLKSLISYAKAENKYDIVILETDISDDNKERLLQINDKKNISIRFLNVSNLFNQHNLHIEYSYFAKQCYFRLAVGKLFSNYKIVLFTDIDIVWNSDVYDYFSVRMDRTAIAADKEVLWTVENRKTLTQSGKSVKDYIANEVKTVEYYNTGVLLVNIKKFNATVTFNKLIKIASEHAFINQEQDVLNQVFSGQFKTLDPMFNYEVIDCNWGGIEPTYEDYTKKINNAKLYHYLTRKKVWNYPSVLKGYIWWQYARQTPFYEEIIARLIDFRISQQKPQNQDVLQLRNELAKIHFPNINNHFAANERQKKLLFVMHHLGRFKMKKAYYGIKKAFAFGEKHKKYQQKYDSVKALIKDAKSFKKQLFKV